VQQHGQRQQRGTISAFRWSMSRNSRRRSSDVGLGH
jgi:hypothetical protein